MRKIINKLNFIKIKTFYFVKDSFKRMRGQAADCEKIFAKDTFDNGYHSSTLAWEISCTVEPGRLQSMGLQSRTLLSDFTFTFFFSPKIYSTLLKPNSKKTNNLIKNRAEDFTRCLNKRICKWKISI